MTRNFTMGKRTRDDKGNGNDGNYCLSFGQKEYTLYKQIKVCLSTVGGFSQFFPDHVIQATFLLIFTCC